MKDLLNMNLLSDDLKEEFGADVGIKCGGLAIKADAIFGIKEAEVIEHAIRRGIEILKRGDK